MSPEEEQAFTEFVSAHGDELLRCARRIFPDPAEAEDALQTALVRLARHWGRSLESPFGYVRTTLVNLAKDRFRRRHLVASPVEPGHHRELSTPDHADAVAAQAALEELLGLLPCRQRLTVVLRVLDGLSEAETAVVMRCSRGTVKSNLARGLQNLRERAAGLSLPVGGAR